MTSDHSRAFSRLEGKVAVITGGTQGVGAAIARAYAREGAAGIVTCGRQAEQGEQIAAELRAAGCNAIFVRADLAEVNDAIAVARKADGAFGRIDVLVNAAGITDRGNILDTTPELFDRMFAVNVRAPFFLIQETVKVMMREKIAGSIVNIQSMSAHGGQPFIAAYCTSKGALATLTKNTANALLNHRIRVNGLNIGWMHTPGEDRIMKTFHSAADDWIVAAAKSRPFGRLIDPDEVARACVYLGSDESGLMTGSNIDFDQKVDGTSEPPLPVLQGAHP